MSLRLRQIALLAEDLETAGAELSELFRLGSPYRDPAVAKYGLNNLVFALKRGFIEIVSPAQSGSSAGRLLQKRGGDGGYMVILQTDDLAKARARAEAAGARVVETIRIDGAEAVHLHPKDLGGPILSLDEMSPPERWAWAGPGWEERTADPLAQALVLAEIQSQDPQALAERWARILGRPAVHGPDGSEIALDEGRLRFVRALDGRGGGLGGFGVAALAPEGMLAHAERSGRRETGGAVRVLGTRVYVEPAECSCFVHGARS